MAVSSKISVSRYVNFNKAIRHFNMALLSIQNQQPVKHVVEWIGGPGTGKTSLIQKLIQEECAPSKGTLVWTYVNFKSAQELGLNYYHDPTVLVEFMANELALDKKYPALGQAILTYRDVKPKGDYISEYYGLKRNNLPPIWQDAMNKVCSYFVEFVDSLGYEKGKIKPVIFFIDESESVEYDFVDWFEDHILSRLVLKEYCLIAWTGQLEWRWKRPEIRNQLIRFTLGYFEPEDVEEYIRVNHPEKANVLRPWADEIHKLSGGHGYSVALAVNILDDWINNHPGQNLSGNFDEISCQLLSKLRQDFVLEYAFDGLDNDLVVAMEILAFLRMVDINLISYILSNMYPDKFSNTIDDAFSLLARLKNTDLMVWKNPSYVVGDDIRRVINAYYRKCDSKTYQKIHMLAASAYTELLEKAQDNRNLFFIELLYHLAAQRQFDRSINLEKVFQQQLQKYLFRVENREFLEYTLLQLEEILEYDTELADLSGSISSNIFAQDVQSVLKNLRLG